MFTDVPHLPGSYHGNGDNKDNIYHHVNNDDGLVREDIHSIFDTDNARGEKHHQSLNGVKVVDIDPSSSGDLSPTLVVVVGCAGTLVALLLIGSLVVVCGIRRRRRRQNRLYKGGGGGGLGVPVETYALVQTSSVRRHRQPGDPLPPPDISDPADDVIVVAATPCVNRADSVQRRAWETMLSAAQSGVDDATEFDYYSDEDIRDVTKSPISERAVLKYTPSRAGTAVGRTTGYGATDDGLYHSGDAVDDVIERIDSSNRASQLYTAPKTISKR